MREKTVFLLQKLWPFLALGAFLLCWCFSVAAAGEMSQLGERAILHCGNGTITAQQAASMQSAEQKREEPVAFTAWRQYDSQHARSKVGKSASIDLILVRGRADLALPTGLAFSEEDWDGCLIDRDTAWRLFGDTKAQGAVLKIGETEYTVRGVFSSPAGTVVANAVTQQEGLDRISLDAAGLADGRRAAEQFALRHGLLVSQVDITGEGAALARLLSQFPAGLLGFLLLFGILKQAQRRKKWPVQRILLWMGAAVCATLWALLCSFSFSFPPDLIPTRWSDFEFWQRAWEEYRQRAVDYLLMAKLRPDVQILSLFIKTVWWMGAAFILLLFAQKSQPQTVKGWLALCLYYEIGVFAAVLLSSDQVRIAENRMLWLAPALFFFGNLVLQRLERRGGFLQQEKEG